MGIDYDHDNQHWMGGHMNGGMMGMGWGGWLMMGVVLLTCVAIIVALVVWVVARTPSSASGPTGPHSTTPPPRAHAILDERFARGEIDEQEYLQRRQALLDVHQP